MTTTWPNEGCPCDTAAPNVVPSFVGNDYFCESGIHSEWNFDYILYSNDVLWDGQGCTSTSTCCQFNSPPWFTKNLPTRTTDDIELRICVEHTPSTEDSLNSMCSNCILVDNLVTMHNAIVSMNYTLFSHMEFLLLPFHVYI